ncbi:MAG TPA: hypothetical protein VJS68_02860, partial [Thermoplasmata archaeon]|nr:hypothetical protein [Thermoplasmata archaeon]
MTEAAPPLFLLAPKALLRAPPRPKVPPEYELRPYRFGDEMAYATLLNEIDPKLALAPYVEWTLAHALPEGLFFLVHIPTQHPAATAVALHDPKPGPAEFPFGGEVGNLVTATGHRGHGLGAAALGAALGRL